MATPASSIHEPRTKPRAAGTEAGGERQRAQAGRRVDADDADGVGGIGVRGVLRPRRAVVPAPVPDPAGARARRAPSPSAAARRPPGHRRPPSRSPRSRRSRRRRRPTAASPSSRPRLLRRGGRRRVEGVSRAGRGDVGVLAPAQVEHRALGADRRQPREVVLGWRRRRRPLQRVGVPRIGTDRRRRCAASARRRRRRG